MSSSGFSRKCVSLAFTGFMTALLPVVAIGAEPASLKVCTRPGAGFFTRDASGAPSGLEFDLLRSFALARKAELVIEDAPSFDELLARAEAGKCDLAAAEITVTAERSRRFAFSDPYFPNRILVVQKAPSALVKPDDLKGKRVAVVGGTEQARLIEAIGGVTLVNVKEDDALFDKVAKGEADALVCDSAVVLHHLSRRPEFTTAFPLGERSYFAFALPRASKLGAALNAHLASLVRSGEFRRMLGKHFGEGNASFLADEISSSKKRR